MALLVAGVAGLRGVMRGPCGWALGPHVDGARSTAACADIRPQIGGTAPPSERSGLRVSQTRFFEAADRPETLMQSTMIDSASTNSEPDWLDRAAYPFQHQYLELPEGRIHYVDEGQGEPVVFVHGTPTWSFEFRHLIRAVRGTHRAIALDHFGFGLSDRPEAFPYTPEAHAEVFAEFVERLGLTRFALVVHDIGGPIALPVALERPERISRLVVMNSFMWPLDADKELAKNARFAASELGRMLYRHVNASLRIVMPNAYFDRQKLTAEIHRQYTSVFPDGEARERVLWQLARDLLDSGDHYARLWQRREALRGIPALLVWGMQDNAFAPHHLRRWQRALPDAQTLDVGDAGHWPHEEQPQIVAAALQRFLESAAIG